MSANGKSQEQYNDLVMSFLSVRRAVGLLGFFLPLALLGYELMRWRGPLHSLSDYFYSPMREIFTGTLCAIAVFLWNYKGYHHKRMAGEVISDKAVSRVASLGALLVAFAPISPEIADPSAPDLTHGATFLQELLGARICKYLHFAGATAFFGALAVYCLVLFTRTDKPDPDPKKRRDNRIYRLCGRVILASMAVIALLFAIGANHAAFSPVFWLETTACFAFATSWMVKGKSLRT